MKILALVIVVAVLGAQGAAAGEAPLAASLARLENDLVKRFGEEQRARAARGLSQVARFWRAEDGPAAAFEAFVREHFAGDAATLDTMVGRFESLFEKIDGHMNALVLALKEQADLDRGPILPFDEIFAGYDPGAHLTEDFFANKLAFTVLLNVPITTLEERLRDGASWSRRAWAETKLAQRFSKRIPAEVNQAIAVVAAEADQYIAQYNIWMHHLVDGEGRRLFPPKLRLLSHWNLRDEIKACYGMDDAAAAIAKQRAIQQVMERIVTQTIPEVVIDNPHIDWNPATNQVRAAAAADADAATAATLPERVRRQLEDVRAVTGWVDSPPEPARRYEVLLNGFHALRKADPFSPTAPTHIDRRFNEDRQLPEGRVKAMLEAIVSSPLVAEVGALIAARLGRPLEPFDIWYNGFRPQPERSEAELDAIVSKKYPTAEAFERDIPRVLERLGFSRARAEYLARKIAVDPARGSGHAWGAAMRTEKSRLRTRVEPGGMNYKGFNIALHELGHNVEQVFSLYNVDRTLLAGVPNTAFTEAMAFVFQARDLDVLGVAKANPRRAASAVLNDFWATYEIAGVALVDMAVWHWMYGHPAATPLELRDAVLAIAKDVWNAYYAPVFKRRDVVLLGIYSHMINSFLYLPDYPIGHLIAHQIGEHMERAGDFGATIERMTTFGALTPDLWMQNATGSPVGADAMLEATKRALEAVTK